MMVDFGAAEERKVATVLGVEKLVTAVVTAIQEQGRSASAGSRGSTCSHACPFRCFRCKVRPCAKGAGAGLHALPHLCLAAMNGWPCYAGPLPEPAPDSDDDAGDGPDGSTDAKPDKCFTDSADKGNGMVSQDSFDGSEVLVLKAECSE